MRYDQRFARAKDFVAQVIGTAKAAKTAPQSNYQRLIRSFRAMAGDEFYAQVRRALHH